MLLSSTLSALAIALIADRIAGEPEWLWGRLPHPVVLFGRAIEQLESRWNNPDLSFRAQQRRGVVVLAGLTLSGLAAGAAIEAVLPAGVPGILALGLMASTLLAHRSLADHVSAVAAALRARGVQGGREAVALIVGRDVGELRVSGVARAAIESAAENFSDGLVAPAFWFALLGMPGLIVYKLVNTADSMIGHRTPRYEAFGWAAARLDDALNFIPARLSAALMVIAAPVVGGSARAALEAAWRDAPRHRSPNAGWPEAATAGSLGLALGGPRSYGDVSVEGAWLNQHGRAEAGEGDIGAALRLIDVSWAILAAAVAGGALTVLWSGR